MPDCLADDNSYDGREVEEADLFRAKPVYGLEEDGQSRVDAHNPRECLDPGPLIALENWPYHTGDPSSLAKEAMRELTRK